MTRVLSALVLLPIVVGTIWFLSPLATLLLAEVVLLFAFIEYAALCARTGARFTQAPALVAAAVTCAAFGLVPTMALAVLMTATVGLALVQLGQPDGTLAEMAASSCTILYLAVPLGALVAIRMSAGRETLLLFLVVIVVSDIAQYYGGRAFGRHPLAPAISPKKTVEGAVFGFAAGVLVLLLVGAWWLPGVHPVLRAVLGATLAGLGIAGDLFESKLKRTADVKDASCLIPGHGGVLDRVDGILFAAPVYYAVVYLAR